MDLSHHGTRDLDIFLASSIVEDTPLAGQKPQQRLSPQRFQQSIRLIFALIGSPAGPPKQRGILSGYPKGKRRTLKPRYLVVKKTPVVVKTV